MIKVSVFYPAEGNPRFDMDYYLQKHIPMVKEKLGAAMKSISVDVGLGGGAPDQPAPFLAMAHMRFESVDAFQGAFGPHAGEIMSDIPNYTDIQPLLQVSEIQG